MGYAGTLPMPTLPYLGQVPSLGPDVEIEPDAFAIGQVTIAGPARLARSAVVRGDEASIQIGARFSIGPRSTIHVDRDSPTRIGSDVWIGEDAVAHSCTLGDGVRLEDGALVLSGSTVGAGSVVAADSLVPEGALFPANSLISGTPGRRLRETTPEERAETAARIARAFGYDRPH